MKKYTFCGTENADEFQNFANLEDEARKNVRE